MATVPETVPPDATVGPLPSGRIAIGAVEQVRADAAGSPLYVPEARAWVVRVDGLAGGAVIGEFDEALRPGLEAGLLALYEKCPHLGCRVPFCESSGWFECPCHASKYTSLGEHRDGPGPRGMDAFALVVDDGMASIDATGFITGRPIGSALFDQPVVGPSCVD